MDIAFRGHNVELSDALRVTVTEKVTRLGRYLDGMDRVEVWFHEERNPRIAEREVCEITMYGHGHIVRAKASAPDTMAVVDRAVDKLEHRIEKLKGQLIGRSRPRRRRSVDFAAPAGADDEDLTRDDDTADGQMKGQPKIVKTKAFDIKPMTPEEAALQMELLGHDFFFFTNAETHKAAVVYRRNDGHVGLIDAAS
jgi:putative sigma-54 modulation protein